MRRGRRAACRSVSRALSRSRSRSKTRLRVAQQLNEREPASRTDRFHNTQPFTLPGQSDPVVVSGQHMPHQGAHTGCPSGAAYRTLDVFLLPSTTTTSVRSIDPSSDVTLPITVHLVCPVTCNPPRLDSMLLYVEEIAFLMEPDHNDRTNLMQRILQAPDDLDVATHTEHLHVVSVCDMWRLIERFVRFDVTDARYAALVLRLDHIDSVARHLAECYRRRSTSISPETKDDVQTPQNAQQQQQQQQPQQQQQKQQQQQQPQPQQLLLPPSPSPLVNESKLVRASRRVDALAQLEQQLSASLSKHKLHVRILSTSSKNEPLVQQARSMLFHTFPRQLVLPILSDARRMQLLVLCSTANTMCAVAVTACLSNQTMHVPLIVCSGTANNTTETDVYNFLVQTLVQWVKTMARVRHPSTIVVPVPNEEQAFWQSHLFEACHASTDEAIQFSFKHAPAWKRVFSV